MKTKLTLLFAGIILVILSVLPAPSQQAPTSQGTTAKPAAQSEGPRFLIVDRTTWEVKNPFNQGIDLAPLNTFELKMERYKALLAIEFPKEYTTSAFRLRLAEQVAAAKISTASIEHPIALKDYLAQPRSPEEQKVLEEALKAMPDLHR